MFKELIVLIIGHADMSVRNMYIISNRLLVSWQYVIWLKQEGWFNEDDNDILYHHHYCCCCVVVLIAAFATIIIFIISNNNLFTIIRNDQNYVSKITAAALAIWYKVIAAIMLIGIKHCPCSTFWVNEGFPGIGISKMQ